MPLWFWLNVPACILFLLATAGVPLWLVFTRSDEAPIPDRGRGFGERARPRVAVPVGS